MPDTDLLTILLLGIASALLLAGIAARALQRAPVHRCKPLLSEWERRVLGELRAALPAGWHVCPQVRLADFINADGGSSKALWTANARLRSRSVDFVLIDRTSVPRLVIELDDRSHALPHRRQRDAQNDAAFAEAGVPIVHVRPGKSPAWSALIETASPSV